MRQQTHRNGLCLPFAYPIALLCFALFLTQNIVLWVHRHAFVLHIIMYIKCTDRSYKRRIQIYSNAETFALLSVRCTTIYCVNVIDHFFSIFFVSRKRFNANDWILMQMLCIFFFCECVFYERILNFRSLILCVSVWWWLCVHQRSQCVGYGKKREQRNDCVRSTYCTTYICAMSTSCHATKKLLKRMRSECEQRRAAWRWCRRWQKHMTKMRV